MFIFKKTNKCTLTKTETFICQTQVRLSLTHEGALRTDKYSTPHWLRNLSCHGINKMLFLQMLLERTQGFD